MSYEGDVMDTSEMLATLEAAESIAYIYGDTETARRLSSLAAEVEAANDVPDNPQLICPVCGGNVDIGPRSQCQSCGFVFSA